VQPALVDLLDASFLGVPEVLERPTDLLEAELLRVRLAGSSLSQHRNRGEAEAIFLARRRRGVFVSEDRDARVLAAGELGPGQVVGTPDLLVRAVRMRLVRPEGAVEVYRAMLAGGRRPGRLDAERLEG
jgi:predicted nucleic acid-binding protein